MAHGYGLRSSSRTPSVHSQGSAATAGARFTRRKSPLAVGASTPSSFASSDDLARRDHDLAEGRSAEIADLPEFR